MTIELLNGPTGIFDDPWYYGFVGLRNGVRIIHVSKEFMFTNKRLCERVIWYAILWGSLEGFNYKDFNY